MLHELILFGVFHAAHDALEEVDFQWLRLCLLIDVLFSNMAHHVVSLRKCAIAIAADMILFFGVAGPDMSL